MQNVRQTGATRRAISLIQIECSQSDCKTWDNINERKDFNYRIFEASFSGIIDVFLQRPVLPGPLLYI
jgi:hypothetical protein